MPKQKKPWHTGSYHRRSMKVRAAAYGSPDTRCWRCGRTLEQHGPQRNGRPPRWQAGHVVDSDPTSPLMAEASSCNARAGQRFTAAKLRQKRHPTVPRRTDLTW